MRTHNRQELFGALLSGLGSLCLYILTLAPTVQGFDSAELTVGAYDLGFVHPPGYPLYMLIGHFFSRLPIGNPGFCLNLMSAIFASLAACLLFKLLFRQTGSFWASLISTTLFAASPMVWSQAIRAEVYTLHLFLMTAALLAWFYAYQTRRVSGYWICFLVLGFGAGNHTTTILLWLSALICAFWFDASHRRSILLANLLAAAVAVSIYLYFPLRAQASLQVDYIRSYFSINPGTLNGLVWMISGSAFRCLYLRPDNLSGLLHEAARLAGFLWDGLFGFGLVLGPWGWLILHKTHRSWNYLLSIYFLFNLMMFLAYGAVDKEVMFLPVFLVISSWVANGFIGFTQWMVAKNQSLRLGAVQAITGMVLMVVCLIGVATAWKTVSLHNDRQVYDFATNIIKEVSPSTTIVNHWITASVFDYLKIVEGRRPDVKIINVDFYFLGIQEGCHLITGEQLLGNGWIFWLENLSKQDQLCYIEPVHSLPSGFAWKRNGSCYELELQNP